MHFDNEAIEKVRQFARRLRKKPTGAEHLLRFCLKKAKAGRLRRQFVVGRLILDLALPSRNLLIELDGQSHEETGDRDRRRDAWLRGCGFLVLRIANEDVFSNQEGVVRQVLGLPASEESRERFRLACEVAKRKSYLLPEDGENG